MSGAADPRARVARPQRGSRRTARGRGLERGCDPLRQDRVGRPVGADRGRRSEKVALAYHWGPVVVSFARDVASFRRSAAGWGGGEA